MTHDFGGARLVLPRDRELLGFVMSQFLYGEVTGIQCGHWLYHAPDLEAARFFAKQSVEELTHVKHIQRIFGILGAAPEPPHPAIRFLATGFMGGTFAEHVALEMAQGEGFVLQAFYAVIDTLDHKPSIDILRRAVKQEERHVEFGEQQTAKAIEGKGWLRRRLLGLSLVSMWGVRRLARYMERRLASAGSPGSPREHPVMKHLPAFLAHANVCAELRLRRIGVLDRPLAELSATKRALLVAEAYGGKLFGGLVSLVTLPLRVLPFWPFWPKKKRLTETYLRDAYLTGFALPAGPLPDEAQPQEP
jgi:bacterioferritin (cytochrome b1)